MSDPKHTLVVTCLVRDDDGNILLINSPKRGWELPQGRVEEGEPLTEAIRREVLEETGIDAEPLSLAGVQSQLSPPPALILLFTARYLSGEPTPSPESTEVGWFSPQQALAMVQHRVNRERLDMLLTYNGAPDYCAYSTRPFLVHEKRVLATSEKQKHTDEQ